MLTIYKQLKLQSGTLNFPRIISFDIDSMDIIMNLNDKSKGSNFLRYLCIRKQRYLRNYKYQIITIGEIDYNIIYGNGGNRIHIYDFLLPLEYRNKGFGSILMKELINFARVEGIKCINGELGKSDLCDSSDLNHRSRILHFYRKHQFIINLLPHGCSGQIELTL